MEPSGRRATISVNVPPRSIQNCQPASARAFKTKEPRTQNSELRTQHSALSTQHPALRTDSSTTPSDQEQAPKLRMLRTGKRVDKESIRAQHAALGRAEDT